MFNQLADQFRNNNHHYSDTANPFLTAAATYLGSELLQHHHSHHHSDHTDSENDGHNDHRSHLWRNAALSGLLAYGLNKYQEHQQLKSDNYNYPSSYYPPSTYYHSRPPYRPSYYYPYSAYMTMNPYHQYQPQLYMHPYQQQLPPTLYGGSNNFILPQRYHYPQHYSSFPPSQSYPHHMIPYHRSLPYRYMS